MKEAALKGIHTGTSEIAWPSALDPAEEIESPH
jgi:hypothetical protein